LVAIFTEKAEHYFNDSKLNLIISCSPKYTETPEHLHGKL